MGPRAPEEGLITCSRAGLFIRTEVRGCNPAPGAWTTLAGKKLQIFDARKAVFRRFADVPGKIGEVSDVTPQSIKVTAHGGTIEVLKARLELLRIPPNVESRFLQLVRQLFGHFKVGVTR